MFYLFLHLFCQILNKQILLAYNKNRYLMHKFKFFKVNGERLINKDDTLWFIVDRNLGCFKS